MLPIFYFLWTLNIFYEICFNDKTFECRCFLLQKIVIILHLYVYIHIFIWQRIHLFIHPSYNRDIISFSANSFFLLLLLLFSSVLVCRLRLNAFIDESHCFKFIFLCIWHAEYVFADFREIN